MAAIAVPVDLTKYQPYQPTAAVPQGDAVAAAIEKLKGNPGYETGYLLGVLTPEQAEASRQVIEGPGNRTAIQAGRGIGAFAGTSPYPLAVGQALGSQPKVSPDGSVQLQSSAPALNPAWEAQGMTPPQAGNQEAFLGRVMNKVRSLGPDWKEQVLKAGMQPVNFK